MAGNDPRLCWLLWLIALAPTVPIAAGAIGARRAPGLHAIAWGYLAYAFRILYLLLVQAIAIPLFFLFGPVWAIGLLLTTADLVAGLASGAGFETLPTLCPWLGNVGLPCAQTLVAYHVVSASLALVMLGHGGVVLSGLGRWYRTVRRFLDHRAGL